MDTDNLKFGCIQSPPDYRDWQYGMLFGEVELPRSFSLVGKCGPVRDQGNYASCCGQAGSGVKDEHEQLVTSPLFIYDWCKQLDGIPTIEGTYPRVVLHVLVYKGVCLEATFDYGRMSWPKLPAIPDEANQEALKFKIGGYARVQTLQEIKQALVNSGPVLAGVLVCDSFVRAPGGYVPIPGSKGADYVRGGHAICICGYDDDLEANGYTGYFIFKNSWGTDWGSAGYGYIPYDFVTWRDVNTGQPAWIESWSCVDVIVPDPIASKDIMLWIGKRTAKVDGQFVTLDVEPYIVPGADRTVVPLRFISENMGYKVDWDGVEQSIHIYKP